MTTFEYLAVLISIILGMGLTELLAGVRRLAHARDRVRFHWLPLAWSGLLFVALVQWWWAAFGLRQQTEWNFFSFLLILFVPVLQYLAAALILPARESEGQYDLGAHYFGIHRLFFSVVAAASLLEMVRAIRVGDAQAAALDLAATILLASLAIVRNPRYHVFGTLGTAAVLATFILAETFRIG